jgi:hypothetical protein
MQPTWPIVCGKGFQPVEKSDVESAIEIGES